MWLRTFVDKSGTNLLTSHSTLKIYGPTNKKAQLEPVLKWATPGQRGFGTPASASRTPSRGARATAAAGPSSSQGIPRASQAYTFSNTQLRTPVAPAPRAPVVPVTYAPAVPRLSAAEIAAQQEAQRKHQEEVARAAELRLILNNMEKVDDEGRRSTLLDTLCSTEDVLGLPVHPNPPGKQSGELKVDLLKHQVWLSYFSFRLFIFTRKCRAKPFSGVWSMSIPFYLRNFLINRCNFGSCVRPARMYVVPSSCFALLIRCNAWMQIFYYNSK